MLQGAYRLCQRAHHVPFSLLSRSWYTLEIVIVQNAGRKIGLQGNVG